MKMPVWFWLLVVVGAVLVGRAFGWGAGHAAAENSELERMAAEPAAAPAPPAPPPGFVLDEPQVVDTAQVDRMNAEARHDAQVRRDAQTTADELEARQRARGTQP